MSDLKGAGDYLHSSLTDRTQQMKLVVEYLSNEGSMPETAIEAEVSWFFNDLGIEDIFFIGQSVEKISEFVLSVWAAKILKQTKSSTATDILEKEQEKEVKRKTPFSSASEDLKREESKAEELDISLHHETEHGAIFMCSSKPGKSASHGPLYERRIDAEYLSRDDVAWRVETYRSKGSVKGSNTQLRCYFLQKSEFKHPAAPRDATSLDIIGSTSFMEVASENTQEVYQALIKRAVKRAGPVIESFHYPETEECRVVIAYRPAETTDFFSGISDLYHFYNLYSTRKFVEPFSNGITVISLYLKQVPGNETPFELCIKQMEREISLVFILPNSPFRFLYVNKVLSMQEITYAFAGWKFCEHFINRLGEEYEILVKVLGQIPESDSTTHQDLLDKLKMRLRMDTYSSSYIQQILMTYPLLLRSLYAQFASTHKVDFIVKTSRRTLSAQRIEESIPVTDTASLTTLIKGTVTNANEAKIFLTLMEFNKHILKTNFFQFTKTALSFRLDPGFLPQSEYPDSVYGMFFVVGNLFRGFHVRFQNVARGGIRVIKSATNEAYGRNVNTLFDENYNLAATQQRKNKDIPEGGSKGTILLDFGAHEYAESAFKCYVDSILDLLLIGTKEPLVDKYGKPEILFFGPDEGTADYMDWASLYAKERGAPFWKAFTTGKGREFGGIPHDLYGMTTRSVHQYVVGLLAKNSIDESSCTKVQTGGPDGDLGSNEIKISKDKTIAIIDGSGVIYDPVGLDREELLRLANARKMISSFDTDKLSGEGAYRVLITDRNITLPDGTLVPNGMTYRNSFHLSQSLSATLFVPCGGRPAAVTLGNVDKLFTTDGPNAEKKPRYKFIVEGANLFFTQQARLALEKGGAFVIKDASANKGGVTSSSLEVYAALALPDNLYETHMRVFKSKDGTCCVPDFYATYVQQVQQIIEANAALEFECIWNEWEKTRVPMSIISNSLSNAVNELATELEGSKLWANANLRKYVLGKYTPPALLSLIGLEGVEKNVPQDYLKAIFGSYLASRFIYSEGLNNSPFAFFEFITDLIASASG